MFIESYHRRLFYEYEGNRLSYLTERATASMATNDVYVPGPTARMGYSYDSNGNMTNDYRKGLKFQYNFVNLVRKVQDDGGSTLAEYTYSVDGRKRQAVGGDGKGFRYRGDLVYTVEGGSLSLESAAFGEGRIAKTSGSYSPLYFVTGHLGSVRVVEDLSGTVCESNDYYPSGSRWKDPTSKVSTNRYRFSGKEEQTLGDLGYLDFGARMYDPALGRWFTQDPLAEKYYSVSPYAYCNNNPIKLIDPDGMKIDTTMLSKDQMAIYRKAADVLVGSSNLFATMYRSLEQSSEVYAIEFGQTALNQSGSHVSGQFMSDKNGGGTVMFLEGTSYIDGNILVEELFHAYQHDNRNEYQQGDFNREFEAKVAVTAIGMDQPKGMVFQNYQGMDVFQNNIVQGIYKENGVIIGPAIVRSSNFVTEYKNAANRYAEFNKRTNFGNTHYWRSTTIAPFSLQKLIKDTYSK